MTLDQIIGFYIGRKFVCIDKAGIEYCGVLYGLQVFTDNTVHFGMEGVDDYFYQSEIISVKPILKHAEDMELNRDARAHYKSLCKKIYTRSKVISVVDTPASLAYAISEGYDMFDLIKDDRALDELEYKK